MKYGPGKNPNSLANLKSRKGLVPGFAAKVACVLNWTKRQMLGSMANGLHLFHLMREAEWDTLTLERRTAIMEVEKAILEWRKQGSEVLRKIEAVKDTPLRTPEAHAARLRERRIARRRKETAK